MLKANIHIADFISELSDLQMSDLLVQLPTSKQCIEIATDSSHSEWVLPLTNDWSSILKTATTNKREADIDSLCITELVIEWEYKSTRIQTPLILSPLTWKQVHGNQTVHLKKDAENWIFNPFMKWYLEHFCDCLVEIEAAEELLDFQDKLLSLLNERAIPYQTVQKSVIGNFHHHRFFVLRDLELIEKAPEKSTLLKTILGEETVPTGNLTFDNSGTLVVLDADQTAAFQQSFKSNLVIQGPPGTGKSQVLTALIGQSIQGLQSTLVVSEKKVALEVLVKKLDEYSLSNFCFIAHSKIKANDFVQQLKRSWTALEEIPIEHQPFAYTSKQRIDQLQLLLDRLSVPDLVGGVSFAEASKLKSTIVSNNYQSNVPLLKDWEEQRIKLAEFETKFGSFQLLRKFKASLYKQSNYDAILSQLKKDAKAIFSLFGLDHLSDIKQEWKNTQRIQLLENEASKFYWNIIQSKKARKDWDKNVRTFKDLQGKKKLLENEVNSWKELPNNTQLASWKKKLSERNNWWNRTKLNKQIRNHLKDNNSEITIAVNQLSAYYRVLEEEAQLLTEFQQLGIERPELELDAINYVLQQLESEDQNELNQLVKLSATERTKRLKHQQLLKHFLDDAYRYCRMNDIDSLSEFFSDIESELNQLSEMSTYFHLLDDSILELVASYQTMQEINACVIYSNWRKFEQFNPNLAQMNGAEIQRLTQQIIDAETEETVAFIAQTWRKRKQVFDEYATLLRTPANKLNTEERTLKNQLKIGKRLLVKEFSKSKAHPTIRELYASEAKIWIELLLPVWLSTPSQVAKLLPLENELFDILLLDEASQIPLPNAFGALQRSKRLVIAGDEQQMAPSNYFGTGTSSSDVLSYATYYWSKVMLKHHYRSADPALISFSNKHFYKNELVVYPSPNQSIAIHDHYCENGNYENGLNTNEAEATAKFIATLNPNFSWGIVAFSEQQLDHIWKSCSTELKEIIQSKLNDGTAFFKTLEQVQGDEADIVVISFGYGKNSEGKFLHRFGPVNQQNGSKRLNVLFSRAKMQLHWFSSVRGEDFVLSTNEAVNLLRLFFMELKNDFKLNTTQLPHQLTPTLVDGNKLKINNIQNQLPNARELVTFQRVMQNRGWQLNYD